jgi:hypothetical protein
MVAPNARPNWRNRGLARRVIDGGAGNRAFCRSLDVVSTADHGKQSEVITPPAGGDYSWF